jgi:hypothetical protein
MLVSPRPLQSSVLCGLLGLVAVSLQKEEEGFFLLCSGVQRKAQPLCSQRMVPTHMACPRRAGGLMEEPFILVPRCHSQALMVLLLMESLHLLGPRLQALPGERVNPPGSWAHPRPHGAWAEPLHRSCCCAWKLLCAC